jgi:micrococcal nuclease
MLFKKKAQLKGIGIWSIENYAKEDGYHSDAAKGSRESSTAKSNRNAYQNISKDDQESNLNCKGKIKGNENSHIYHVPGGAFYDSTKDNIIWFCSEQEAQNAGFRKSKR